MPSATPGTQTMEAATSVSINTAKIKRTLSHPRLVDLLQKAYSAEKAAAFAYQGHAASLSIFI